MNLQPFGLRDLALTEKFEHPRLSCQALEITILNTREIVPFEMIRCLYPLSKAHPQSITSNLKNLLVSNALIKNMSGKTKWRTGEDSNSRPLDS